MFKQVKQLSRLTIIICNKAQGDNIFIQQILSNQAFKTGKKTITTCKFYQKVDISFFNEVVVIDISLDCSQFFDFMFNNKLYNQ